MHNKIITKVANDILKPNGMFQKGKSRLWMDDNEWFFGIVEFQPSGYAKGTHLNVAVHFLWNGCEVLTYDYPKGNRIRVSSFIEFDGDEQRFYKLTKHLAKKALKEIRKIRRLQNKKFAVKKILNYNKHLHGLHPNYDMMMLCGLAKDKRAILFYEKLKKMIVDSNDEFAVYLSKEFENSISNIIEDEEMFCRYVKNKVELHREQWNLEFKRL